MHDPIEKGNKKMVSNEIGAIESAHSLWKTKIRSIENQLSSTEMRSSSCYQTAASRIDFCALCVLFAWLFIITLSSHGCIEWHKSILPFIQLLGGGYVKAS